MFFAQSHKLGLSTTLVVLWWLSCSPPIAEAQTTAHVTGEVAFSYTDNLFGAPSQPQPGAAPRISVFYVTLTPGAAVYHNRERSRFLLSYSHPFAFYFNQSRLNTNGDVVLGQGIWELSERDELLVSINAARLSSAARVNTYREIDAVAVGDGRTRMFTFAANEQLSHAFSESWSGRHFNSISRYETLSSPFAQPTRYAVTSGLGLDYVFERNSLGFQSSVTYFWINDVPRQAVLLSSRRQIIIDSFVRYRHDLSESWSWESRLGAVTAISLASRQYTAPRWGTSLMLYREALTADLSYDRTVTANTATGGAYQSDAARLSCGIPLWVKAHLSGTASTGISRNALLLAEQELGSARTDVWATSAAVRYEPGEELPVVSLVYSHFAQRNGGEPSIVVPAFSRNTISLTISGHFPSRAFYEVPRALPQRVDQADRSSLGTQNTQAPAADSTSPHASNYSEDHSR